MRGAGGLHGPRGPPRDRGRRCGHDAVQRVTALVHVQGGSKAAPTVAALLQTLRRTRAQPRRAGHGPAGRGAHRAPALGDGGPGGGGPRAAAAHPAASLPEDDDRETAELPDVDPALLDPVPATVRVVCVLDPAVPADADVRRLHVGAFGKDHASRHLRPLMGAALPQPPPMQAAIRGSMVEVSTNPPSSVALLVLRASGKARGVHFRPWIVTSAACQHPAYVLWFKQPPERRGPSPEVWEDPRRGRGAPLHVRGGWWTGAPPATWGSAFGELSRRTPRWWRTSPTFWVPRPRRRPRPCVSGATPRNWAWRWTSMRNSGATPERRLGPRRPSASTAARSWRTAPLDRPVFDLELEGVPEDWQGVRLGAPDTRLPDWTWEWTTRASRQGRYQPVGPRARMTRPKGPDVVQ